MKEKAEEKYYASYTNSHGDKVSVSKQHIDDAVKIYLELEKDSRSKRVSWARHKRIMEQNGYTDSDSNENYRVLIRRERKKRGVLPSVDKYADMLADEKLNLLKDEIGNLRFERQVAQDNYTQLEKIKRGLSREILTIETIKESIDNLDWENLSIPDYTPINQEQTEKEMVVSLADLHYGYEDDKNYNLIMAEELLELYTDKIINLALKENINHIIIANLGDLISGRLRTQSVYDSQLNSVQQTIQATQHIIKMLLRLAKHFQVSYFAISGNHDRIHPNYRENLEGETYIDINIEMIREFTKDIENIYVIDTIDTYYHILKVKDTNIYLAHGDRDNIKNKNIMDRLSNKFNVFFDIGMFGHYHSFSIDEFDNNRYKVVSGSIIGRDKFSDKINVQSCRSQVAIIVGNDNNFEIRQIKLEN